MAKATRATRRTRRGKAVQREAVTVQLGGGETIDRHAEVTRRLGSTIKAETPGWQRHAEARLTFPARRGLTGQWVDVKLALYATSTQYGGLRGEDRPTVFRFAGPDVDVRALAAALNDVIARADGEARREKGGAR